MMVNLLIISMFPLSSNPITSVKQQYRDCAPDAWFFDYAAMAQRRLSIKGNVVHKVTLTWQLCGKGFLHRHFHNTHPYAVLLLETLQRPCYPTYVNVHVQCQQELLELKVRICKTYIG